MPIRNRIIRFGMQRADQFLANPNNPRIHPQFQRDVMREALNRLGWIAPVIVNQDGYLIDGHERVMQALEHNDEVPFVEVALDNVEAALALATFDPIGDLARYDAPTLGRLLQEARQAADDSKPLQQMLQKIAFIQDVPAEQSAETEWIDMPEFDNQTIKDYFHRIIVYFETEDDMRAFAQLVGQAVNDKTKYIRIPKQRRANLKSYVALDETP